MERERERKVTVEREKGTEIGETSHRKRNGSPERKRK